jgi:catechol 2,3-dioxygenase-like lactoylglutathione lyase family enzyme
LNRGVQQYFIEKGTAMTVASHPVTVQLTIRGDIFEDDRAYALSKVERVLETAHRPVLKAHLVLGWNPDPAHPHPAHLEIGLDVNGIPVRAHIGADSIREGADLLQGRLGRQLHRLQDRARARRRWSEAIDASEAGQRAPRPPDRRPATTEPSEVVRRKTFAARPLTADEAADEMDLLDHDFYLYIDQETGDEAVVHRTQDGAHILLTPPALSEDQARERLDVGGEPFVFFRDPDDSRGRVLYRRFDRGYGLITPF